MIQETWNYRWTEYQYQTIYHWRRGVWNGQE